jgi:CubicO group peptidase (beta-lactamase class C family)
MDDEMSTNMGPDGTAPGSTADRDPAAAGNPAANLLSYVESTLEALAPCSAAVLVSKEGKLLQESYLPGPLPQTAPNPETSPGSAATVPAIPGPDSLWPWWSVTKSAAAALVARLVAAGLFCLDSPISAFLPEFGSSGPGPFDRREVHLRHILSQTSGCAVPGRVENGVDLGPEPPLSEVAVLSSPGTTFVYSSLGMNILERFIEAATGEDYGIALRREILQPFGIPEVGFLYPDDLAGDAAPDGRPGRKARDYLSRRDYSSRILPCLDGAVVPSQPRQRCGLGLYGTARDLLKFGEAWLSGRDASGKTWLDPALRDEIWKVHSTRPSDGSDYGLLWWLFDDLGGKVASGASYSLCALLPEKGVAAVVARNHMGPTKAPFDYRADKRRILELAGAFAP